MKEHHFYESLNEFPISLNVNDVATILRISRTGAYELFHAKDFPSIVIGKRMIVMKEDFNDWLDKQAHK